MLCLRADVAWIVPLVLRIPLCGSADIHRAAVRRHVRVHGHGHAVGYVTTISRQPERGRRLCAARQSGAPARDITGAHREWAMLLAIACSAFILVSFWWAASRRPVKRV